MHKYLQKLNTGKTEVDFARSFKKLFVACKEYYDKLMDSEQRQLARLNRILTRNHDEELAEAAEEQKKRVLIPQNYQLKLKELQIDFFNELKFLSDSVNIPMTEPSMIDLLENQKKNPLNVLHSYNNTDSANTIGTVNKMFNMLAGIRHKREE